MTSFPTSRGELNLVKIEESSNIVIDGITVRDPSYWNTLIYRSDQVTVRNYKVINAYVSGIDFGP